MTPCNPRRLCLFCGSARETKLNHFVKLTLRKVWTFQGKLQASEILWESILIFFSRPLLRRVGWELLHQRVPRNPRCSVSRTGVLVLLHWGSPTCGPMWASWGFSSCPESGFCRISLGLVIRGSDKTKNVIWRPSGRTFNFCKNHVVLGGKNYMKRTMVKDFWSRREIKVHI